MPWFWIIIVIVGIFIVGTVVQGIVGFMSWSNERRVCAQLRKQALERRRQAPQEKQPLRRPP